MPGDLTIRQARLVMPDRVATGDVVIQDGVIADIGPRVDHEVGEVVDGTGLTVLPGAVDVDVCLADQDSGAHDDVATGTRAAAAGGVTSVLIHPPPWRRVSDQGALDDRRAHAEDTAMVNWGFFLDASTDDLDDLVEVRRHCGLYLELGEETGRLEELFARLDGVFVVQRDAGTDPDHLLRSTRLAVEASRRHGRRVHLLRVSSSGEVDLLAALGGKRLSAGVALPHLFLAAAEGVDAEPPVGEAHHGRALWRALSEGLVGCVSSGHASASPGLPGLEWTLPLLLDMASRGEVELRDVARWTSESPARCFGLSRKGRLEVGYDGDVVVVDTEASRPAEPRHSGWPTGPWSAASLRGWPVLTAVRGRPVYRDGGFAPAAHGRELSFAP